MGNDSSFRSFPAHVHNFLREALAETHVIHSKIYPRYKTYKAIDVARDNFSKWLEPHESPSTDVVLVGHSMGGVLAADVALLPGVDAVNGLPLRHRILGTVSLDAPLLGLHPGIVVSGIASLFRPAPAPPGVDSGIESAPVGSGALGRLSPDPSVYSEVSPPSGAPSPTASQFSSPPASQSSANDPYFNPPFFNDVSFVDRGWFRNIANFAKKHREENLIDAATSHIMSHLEFGGCLADYPGLRSRYNRLRKLEDVDDLVQQGGRERPTRVRFVNYYTASTGLPKKPKEVPVTMPVPEQNLLKPNHSRDGSNITAVDASSGLSTPRISIEDYSDSENPALLQELDPVPEPDEPVTPPQAIEPPKISEDDISALATTSTDSITAQNHQLPPIPDMPTPPEVIDLDMYTDKEARKQAEKEAKRAKKVYDQAVKNRDKAIKERQKLIEKRQRQAAKDAEKLEKESRKEAQRKGKTEQKQARHEVNELHREIDALRLEDEQQQQQREKGQRGSQDTQDTQAAAEKKKKKERKFCMLPSKSGGVRDPTWVRVYMEGVDEVGAHCGLFFPGPHYEKLVGEVGSMIQSWVQDDASRRAISEYL